MAVLSADPRYDVTARRREFGSYSAVLRRPTHDAVCCHLDRAHAGTTRPHSAGSGRAPSCAVTPRRPRRPTAPRSTSTLTSSRCWSVGRSQVVGRSIAWSVRPPIAGCRSVGRSQVVGGDRPIRGSVSTLSPVDRSIGRSVDRSISRSSALARSPSLPPRASFLHDTRPVEDLEDCVARVSRRARAAPRAGSRDRRRRTVAPLAPPSPRKPPPSACVLRS